MYGLILLPTWEGRQCPSSGVYNAATTTIFIYLKWNSIMTQSAQAALRDVLYIVIEMNGTYFGIFSWLPIIIIAIFAYYFGPTRSKTRIYGKPKTQTAKLYLSLRIGTKLKFIFYLYNLKYSNIYSVHNITN